MDGLAEEIEALRQELYRLTRTAGLTDPRVLAVSRQLDRLIVQWHRQRQPPGVSPAPAPVSAGDRRRRRQPAPT
ncbi:MAG TPA: aspartyl-phosphate phosphatase Spo0E family protein [Thermaerobacter sp.]